MLENHNLVDVGLGIWYNSVEFSPISGASALQRGADFSGGKAFFLLSIILPVGSSCRKVEGPRTDPFFGIMSRQMEIECPPEETVVKSNQLVKAKTPFTKLEHRVVAALIAQLEKDQDDFGMQTVSLRGITEMSGYNSTDLFLQNRTQAEIEALDEEEVTKLYETTKALAQQKNPGAGESVLASETLRLMERKWKEAT